MEVKPNEIQEHYNDFRKMQYSDDIVLNTLLESYAKKYDELNIEYQYKIECSMEHTIEALDMVKLFSNLMDNALEAVQNNTADKRTINLKICKASNLYRLDIENDLPQRQIELNKKVQGEGLRIVQEVLKHYFGSMEVDESDGMHRTSVTFQSEGDAE